MSEQPQEEWTTENGWIRSPDGEHFSALHFERLVATINAALAKLVADERKKRKALVNGINEALKQLSTIDDFIPSRLVAVTLRDAKVQEQDEHIEKHRAAEAGTEAMG
jgi:hypothetical protein